MADRQAPPGCEPVRTEVYGLRATLVRVLAPDASSDADWIECELLLENWGDAPLAVSTVKLLTASGRYLPAAANFGETLAPPNAAYDIAGNVATSAAGVAAGQLIPYGGLVVQAIAGVAEASSADTRAKAEHRFRLRRIAGVELAPGGHMEGNAFFPRVADPKALVIEFAQHGKWQQGTLPLSHLQGRMAASQCPACGAPRGAGAECPRCGTIYAKAAARVSRLAAPAGAVVHGRGAAVLGEIRLHRKLEEARLELQERTWAVPIAFAVCWVLVKTEMGHFVLRTWLSMWVHELGHAVTAWFCGFFAFPGPWATQLGESRSLLMTLLLGGALGYLGWWGHSQGNRWLIAVAAGLLPLQLLLTFGLSHKSAQALISSARRMSWWTAASFRAAGSPKR